MQANSRELLCTLLKCIAEYSNQSIPQAHLDRATTLVMDEIMLTYGNGEVISKMLYQTINSVYLKKFQCYLRLQPFHFYPHPLSSFEFTPKP